MKYLLMLVVVLMIGIGCEEEHPIVNINEENWTKRKANITNIDTLTFGQTYLSVYSQIYSFVQKEKYNLTAMVSLRNISETDTIYLLKATYFNTEGAKVRTYFDFPIYVLPMETLEIVIAQKDIEGGTGGNFLINWKTPLGCPDPLFDGVMNSMQGNRGISFTTQGKRVK